jgi:hypothetical protein
MVKWAKYIQLQQQIKDMDESLKIPGMINRFTEVLEKQQTKEVFNFVLSLL